jgi:hypothetical protein
LTAAWAFSQSFNPSPHGRRAPRLGEAHAVRHEAVEDDEAINEIFPEKTLDFHLARKARC